MKKKLIFGLASLGLVLVLSACGTSGDKATSIENRPDRRPDFGQPSTQPEIRGVVRSVVGNEVSVLKIDQAQRGAGFASSTSATSTTDKSKTPAISLTGTKTAGTRSGGGFAGSNRPQGGENTDTDRAAMLETMKAMSTGEETVTIPVGIKMLKASTEEPRTMVEASLSDIAADKSITIWLNEAITDKKVASFVLIN